jgi:uncharacterized protein YutE (UPF0331/DUF86 family)
LVPVQSMIDRETLAKYIQELEGYLGRFAELQRYSEEEFLSDWRIHDLADRQLHLTLETFLTVGETVISGCGFRKPDTYADIPRILYENKVIGKQLRDDLVDLARFRNVLVHDYLFLDHEKVYRHVHTDAKTIEEFISAIKQFVAAQQSTSEDCS